MTDTTNIAGNAPLQVTVYPQPKAPADTGRVVNANAGVPQTPDSPDFWGQGGFSFKSFLDTINPLQHIPVVSTIYQAMTGDVPSSGSSLAGGALFGGPLGFAASLIGEISKTQTGKDIGGNMLALIQGNTGAQAAQNTAADGSSSANQKAAYNAYVKTQGIMS